MSFIKVNKIQNLGSAGDGLVIDNKGTVGIATTSTTPDFCLLYTSPSPRD